MLSSLPGTCPISDDRLFKSDATANDVIQDFSSILPSLSLYKPDTKNFLNLVRLEVAEAK